MIMIMIMIMIIIIPPRFEFRVITIIARSAPRSEALSINLTLFFLLPLLLLFHLFVYRVSTRDDSLAYRVIVWHFNEPYRRPCLSAPAVLPRV